jgi:hypothetical protein
MRAAVIEDGIVSNIIEVQSLDVFLGLVSAAGAHIGDAWDGKKFTSPAPVTPVPPSISPAQARLALLGAGLLDQVEAAVAGADLATHIAWAQATSIERDSPTVAALSAALGLSAAQLDALFIAGAAIRV